MPVQDTKTPVILLTIKSEYAEEILENNKKFEFRKKPPRINVPARTIIYVSGRKELTGEFMLEPVSGAKTSNGYPLPVKNPTRYVSPVSWKSVLEKIPGIRGPQQNFRYLDANNREDMLLLELLEKL